MLPGCGFGGYNLLIVVKIRMRKTWLYLWPILIILYLCFNSIYFFMTYLHSHSNLSIDNVNVFTCDNVFLHDKYIDEYGLIQRLLGKKQIETFTIFKTNYEKLVAPRNSLTTDEVQAAFQELNSLIECCRQHAIPYYYITSILPIQSLDDLPCGVYDSSFENRTRLASILHDNNICTIDLQHLAENHNIPKDLLFYKTDHHWTMFTCFAAYQDIISRISSDFSVPLNSAITTDPDQYSLLLRKDSFLGSYGIKVGKYYVGKDDFNVYLPNFTTNFVFQSYDKEGSLLMEKRGDFYEALLDDSIISDQSYANKYNAFCNHGYIENHIVNLNAPNNLRCLYISHSYGRPLTMYLALNFQEIVNLDPQVGRFDGNYSDYLDAFSPNVVLIQAEFEGEIVGHFSVSD